MLCSSIIVVRQYTYYVYLYLYFDLTHTRVFPHLCLFLFFMTLDIRSATSPSPIFSGDLLSSAHFLTFCGGIVRLFFAFGNSSGSMA